MDKLFITIRKVHLYSSFVTAAFLLMFFLTGAVMIMGKIFPRPMKESLNQEVVIQSGKLETENIAEICKRFNIRGEETVKALPGGKKSYSYFRAAYRAEIVLYEENATARVKVTEGNFWAAMNDFHRLRGFTGNWAHKLWFLLYDLSCIALVLMAITGVYLWWKLEKKKKTGIIFLFVSTGITIFTVMYIIAIC
jgi:hypothetical protein